MTAVAQYVVVYERALENVFTVGPFYNKDKAQDYARTHHDFPQVWRIAELRPPEAAKEEKNAE